MAMLLGYKLGMTRIFKENGRVVPVTLVQSGPCEVIDKKTPTRDGYSALKISFSSRFKNLQNHLKEWRVDEELASQFNVGHTFDVDSLSIGQKMIATAVSKGKGFAGVIKRHNFHRGPETHGSDHHRAPGSIGSMFPQHVRKGKKMPGRMGCDQITLRGVEIVDIYPDNHIIAIKGSLPGSNGSLVVFRTK